MRAGRTLAGSCDQANEKRQAKRARKETMKTNLMGIVNSTSVASESTKECVHEVAIPEGYDYIPMVGLLLGPGLLTCGLLPRPAVMSSHQSSPSV